MTTPGGWRCLTQRMRGLRARYDASLLWVLFGCFLLAAFFIQAGIYRWVAGGREANFSQWEAGQPPDIDLRAEEECVEVAEVQHLDSMQANYEIFFPCNLGFFLQLTFGNWNVKSCNDTSETVCQAEGQMYDFFPVICNVATRFPTLPGKLSLLCSFR